MVNFKVNGVWLDEGSIERKIKDAAEKKAKEIAIEKGLAKPGQEIIIKWNNK